MKAPASRRVTAQPDFWTADAPQPERETTGSAARQIRLLLWVYFFLLIFEGALRKWILPQFTGPLLIVRDPVVLLIYVLALYHGKFPKNWLVIATAILGLLSVLVSLMVLQLGSFKYTFLISAYGFRSNFLHLPLIFLIPKFFDAEDVRRIGKWLLLIAIPMTLLVFWQYSAPIDSWINKGAAEDTTQINVAVVGVEKIRPPGVFSFTNGLSLYVAAVAAIVLWFFLERVQISRLLLAAGAAAVVLMLGFSVSRTTMMMTGIVLCAAILAVLVRPQLFRGSFIVAGLGLVVFWIVASWSVYSESLDILSQRFEGAGGLREGILDRFVDGFTRPLEVATSTPFFGWGLGLGTAGGLTMIGLRGVVSLGEAEWTRVFRESGPLLGTAFLLLRAAIAVYIGKRAFSALLDGRTAPLLLFSACALVILQGQWGQPTTLGFAVFLGGLALAAASEKRDTIIGEVSEPDIRPLVRGRSAYAEALHH